MPPTVL
jgi:hypothetical protein